MTCTANLKFAGLLEPQIMANIPNPGISYLSQTARTYLEKRYDTTISNYTFIRRKNGWQPSLIHSISNNFLMFTEASDTPFPKSFRLHYMDMLNHAEPVAAYSVCPEKAWHEKKQSKAIALLKHQGFGLITISKEGKALIRFTASPLVLWISEGNFKSALHGLDSKRLMNGIMQAYEDYKIIPQTGMAEITGMLQQLILKSSSDAIKNRWIVRYIANYGTLECLTEMYKSKNLRSVRNEIESVRAFYEKYRNPGNTHPKSRREAQLRFRDLRLGFLEGIEHIKLYRAAMKSIGLSGNI